MERKQLKETILVDLNSEEYPFLVEIKGNTVIARWKTETIIETEDEKALRSFCVKYMLRKDGTFCGGEATVRREDYTRPMSTETKSVYSIPVSNNLPWRKKVDPKDWPDIGHDSEKLFSIIEHYLMGHGFFYRPGVWSHARVDWENGFKLRLVGVLFVLVGLSLFIGALRTGVLAFILLPWIHIIIGAWLFLIGIGKVDFYDLRPDIAVKLILGIIIVSWLLVFAFMFFIDLPFDILKIFGQ